MNAKRQKIKTLNDFNSSKVKEVWAVRGGARFGECTGSRIDQGVTYIDIMWDDGGPDSCDVKVGNADSVGDSWIGVGIVTD